MTPYYNGNDYYKKMLELQNRLRQSEEERIKLEERFTLLEHESRSRHETCINRLRMRYIEFLEEQQARDERNHKLLGALDRVDTSLALISAKTDRLGNMRRQCEAALLYKNWNIDRNRRSNGSVVLDSGVVSQNTERKKAVKRQQGRATIDKNNDFAFDHPLSNTNITLKTSARSVRPSFTPSKVSSDLSHDTRLPGIIRSERPQMPSQLTGNEPNSITKTRDTVRPFIDKQPESVLQLLQQSPRNYQYNYPRVMSVGYGPTVAQPQTDASFGCRNRVDIQRGSRSASLLGREQFKTPIRNYSRFHDVASLSSVRPPSRFQHIVDDSNQEFVNDENLYSIGGIVENELERYMSRIPRLYREAELRQSLEEEIDHEQNTSGDLLNVTLSDDGIDLLPEAIKLPLEYEGLTVHSVQDQSLNRDVNIVVNDGGKTYQHVSADKPKQTRTDEFNESMKVQHGNTDFHVSYDDENCQLQATESLTNTRPAVGINDKSLVTASNEKIELLAKNRFSPNDERANTEIVTRSSRNNDNISKLHENSNQSDAVETRKIRSNEGRDYTKELQEIPVAGNPVNDSSLQNDRCRLELHSAIPEESDGSKYRVVSGDECETGNNVHDEYTQNLENWDVRALERRVQSEMIIKEELDSIESGHGQQIPSGYTEQDREFNVPRTLTAADDLQEENVKKMDENTSVKSHANAEVAWNTYSYSKETFEDREDIVEQKNKTISQRQQEYNDSNDLLLLDGQRRIVDHEQLLPSDAEESDYPSDNLVDSNVEYGAAQETYVNQANASYAEEKYHQDPYQQHEYPINEQYQEENYQNQPYDLHNNAQYNEASNEGREYAYEVDDQAQYQGYTVGQQDPEYSEDPSQAYSAAANHQEYPVDINGQQYVSDHNQQFSVDQNRSFSESHQYLNDGAQNENVNQGYPAEVYDHSGIPENAGLITEPNDDQDYQEHRSAVPEQSQNYGQEYETSEQEEIQSYAQEHETGLDRQPSSIAYESQNNVHPDQSENKETMSSDVIQEMNDFDETVVRNKGMVGKEDKNIIKSLLDSDTESTIERNVSNTESDFDFN